MCDFFTHTGNLGKIANKEKIEKAKHDVQIFLRDKDSIKIWSHAFFLGLVEKLTFMVNKH